MPQYETLFVLHPEVPEAQVRETVDRAKRLIEGMRGQFDKAHEWGIRDLAYPIHKLRRGYYVVIEYTATGEVVRELERTLRIADEVLRYISVRREEVTRSEKPVRKRTPKPPRPSVADEFPAA
jgi:small subunit ribosomal protein S6